MYTGILLYSLYKCFPITTIEKNTKQNYKYLLGVKRVPYCEFPSVF